MRKSVYITKFLAWLGLSLAAALTSAEKIMDAGQTHPALISPGRQHRTWHSGCDPS